MKIFLDTADQWAIKDYYETGLIDGVTTNPTLIMKSGRNPDNVYQAIKDIGVNDISMEVVGNADEMIDEGTRLFEKFGFCSTIKVPMTRDGLKACKVLSASIRSVQRAVRSWYNGAQICTLPPKVFDQMYDHILTDKGLEIFDKDWESVNEKIQ